jgi:hypothetical protein
MAIPMKLFNLGIINDKMISIIIIIIKIKKEFLLSIIYNEKKYY